MRTGLTLEEAKEALCAGVTPSGPEVLPLAEALGRTLGEEIAAPLDQPPFDRSPLDGYALRAADTAGACRERPVPLAVADTVYAGDAAGVPVRPGQAVRIMTGAMLPPGCDCVLRQEDTDMGSPVVRVFASLRPGDNCVRRGEDYRAGEVLLPAGTRLDAAAVGLLASAGIGSVPVNHRPRVGVLVTGDEVVSPGASPLPAGKIYDANQALLLSRLAELGFPDTVGARAGDSPEAAASAMGRLLETCDLVLTTGGVSVGAKDILHQTLPLLGAEQVFWRVKLKPGSPALFSRYRGKPILSLSGNPFAAFTTFELLARPLLAALSGEPGLLPERRGAILDTPFPKGSPIRRFVRGRFVRGRYGDGHVSLPQGHSSGQLRSLAGCSCLVDIPADSGPLAAGETVEVLML